jgi:hypothetical protein
MKFDGSRQLHVVPLKLRIVLLPLLDIIKVLFSLGFWMMCSSTTYILTFMTLNKTMKIVDLLSRLQIGFQILEGDGYD